MYIPIVLLKKLIRAILFYSKDFLRYFLITNLEITCPIAVIRIDGFVDFWRILDLFVELGVCPRVTEITMSNRLSK